MALHSDFTLIPRDERTSTDAARWYAFRDYMSNKMYGKQGNARRLGSFPGRMGYMSITKGLSKMSVAKA